MGKAFHRAALQALSLIFVGLCAASGDSQEIQSERQSVDLSGTKYDREIGTLFVRENRSASASRLIGVGFARYFAKERRGPPVFLLPGGPGQSYVEPIEGVDAGLTSPPRYLAELVKFADVVCLDQRGFTARGDLLLAPFKTPAPSSDKPRTTQDVVDEYRQFAKSATKKYDGTDIDLRGYNVVECVEDVFELRNALGYDRIVLMGTSFGSQWSFAVMRQHPEIVERAILSGVEPLDNTYDMPTDVMAAVKRMWKEVDENPAFKPYLPDGGMVHAAEVVASRLEKEPLKITKRNFFGFPKTLRVLGPADFPWSQPALILELYQGHTARWASPRKSQDGMRALIGPLIDSSLGVTPARRERLWNDPAVRFLSRTSFATYSGTADIWPSPDVGDDFRRPVRCDIPVVFAQGDWDTMTPIENTYEIAKFFPNSHVLIAKRGGHGVFQPIMGQHPDTWKKLMEFLVSGSLLDLPSSVELLPSRTFEAPTH